MLQHIDLEISLLYFFVTDLDLYEMRMHVLDLDTFIERLDVCVIRDCIAK